ncbi:MAG TPA: hypothetical protein VEX86_24315 [Longimicrobium sp.]|nr:hypothetical protein [Longimicrobium sp.]
MIRRTPFLALSTALLLAACGGGDDHSAAARADSADRVEASSAIPGALGGAPARAQEGADSANAAAARRAAEVEALGNEASGGTTTP